MFFQQLLSKRITLDFGVSEIFEGDRALLKNSAGSPAFLPPEAVNPDVRTFDGQLLDIWACGVTLYIFCFGKVLPFYSIHIHQNDVKTIYHSVNVAHYSYKRGPSRVSKHFCEHYSCR